ncbi:MAG: hypothetical protein MZV70_03515 [Desulfobacterales bacterium]|nr:hypothetical protein [Desulfobacterales bacterium]
MGQQISGGMRGGVAPYTGAIASNPDALSLMAAQMMAQYMNPGSVYQLPTQQMGQNYGAQQQQGQPQMGGGCRRWGNSRRARCRRGSTRSKRSVNEELPDLGAQRVPPQSHAERAEAV